MSEAWVCQGLYFLRVLSDTGPGCVIVPWAALGRAMHFLMVKGGDPFPLLGTGDIKAEGLGPVLDSPVHKQYTFKGVSPVKSHKDD